MLSKEKKHLFFSGRIFSLQVGKCATIYSSHGIVRTSAVAAIASNHSKFVVFETQDYVYCVSPTPSYMNAVAA